MVIIIILPNYHQCQHRQKIIANSTSVGASKSSTANVSQDRKQRSGKCLPDCSTHSFTSCQDYSAHHQHLSYHVNRCNQNTILCLFYAYPYVVFTAQQNYKNNNGTVAMTTTTTYVEGGGGGVGDGDNNNTAKLSSMSTSIEDYCQQYIVQRKKEEG